MKLLNEIKQILFESLDLYTAFILITVDKDVDRMDIFNALRAVPNVVIVKPKDSDFLNSKETDTTGYSYINLKFIAFGSPVDMLKKIRHIAIHGGKTIKKVNGLKGFKINLDKITKVDK